MASESIRHTYRIRPGKGAERALQAEWDRCRWVWNALVAESRDRYVLNLICADNGMAPESLPTFGYKSQDAMLTQWRHRHAWLAEGSSVAQQQTVRDFAAARSKALKDRKDKNLVARRHGLPRFKAKDRSLPSLNYTVRGFSIKPDPRGGADRLVLAGGITIPVVWSRDLPSQPSSVRVSRDSLGHWYASFVVMAEVGNPVPAPNAVPLGIDWGVAEIATTTDDAYDLPHPGHGRRNQAVLARHQKKMARRRRQRGQAPSRGYLAARKQVAKAHKKVSRQRQDDARRWARKVALDHARIAVEDFRPRFMAASRPLARKAADAAIAATKAELLWQAHKHGRDLRLVNPAHTTMDCSSCGARAKHRLPLSERTYTCTHCGVVSPRDKNSAAVMVARAFGSAAAPAGTSGAGAGCNPEDDEGTKSRRPAVGDRAA